MRRTVKGVAFDLGLMVSWYIASATAREYVIGVADLVVISLLDNKDLDTVVAVASNGKISVPSWGTCGQAD